MEAVAQPYWDESRYDRTFTLGLDLGQAADYSALAIEERYLYPVREIDPATGDQKREVRFEIRHLHRFPLGTSYTAIVKDVAGMMKSQELLQWKAQRNRDGARIAPTLIRPSLVIDATGVGRSVCDVFQEAGLALQGVSIHGGETVSKDYQRGICFWNVPKRDLVGQLQVVFQNKHLKISPHLPLAATLAEELRTFTRKISLRTAHESFEHWRDSQHDDIVLACSLAHWWSEGRHKPKVGIVPTLGW